jgi:methylamine---glutamate N-methyltransferase subunit B
MMETETVELETTSTEARVFDLADTDVRELNSELHAPSARSYVVQNPRGAHAVAAGVHDDVEVRIEGDVGYFCAGMNQRGHITIEGSAGPGVAENMMSGSVRVKDDASQSAGATAHGGLLVIEGNASTRCGISLKGADIVVHGNIGAMSAFMAQAGRIVVCGNAADGVGDSIYEARIYIRGTVGELGADCIEKEMRAEHRAELAELLRKSGKAVEADDDAYLDGFRRYGSGRTLYHFNSDQSGSY